MPTSDEAYLISSVIKNGDLRTALAHGVSAEMFHVHFEEWVWIETYFGKYKKPPTRGAFRKQFDDFAMKNVDDTGHYSDEVRKGHAKHLLMECLTGAADSLAAGDIETAVKSMNANVIQIASQMGLHNDGDIFTDYQDILTDVEARVRRVDEQGAAGIPTGIPTLDDRLGGFNPGDLIIIGARLGEGKSWIMQSMASHAAMKGYSVQFDALEQSRAQVAMRIHSLVSGPMGYAVFKNTALMQGKGFNSTDYKKFLRETARRMAGSLHVADTGRGRVSTLTVAAQIERNHPDIVFVDYLTLMAKSSTDWQGVAQLSGDLKNVATQYGIPIVAASQLNRENGMSREPAGAEALAQSDAIGQDADVVITQRQLSASVIKMRLAKNRNGAGDIKWHMQFQPGDGIIKEVTTNEASRLIDLDRDKEDAESGK